MAYSSIGHMGFALVGLAAGTPEGVQGVLIYMVIYVTMTLGVFACILAMRRDGTLVENIGDLAGLARTKPTMAFFLAMLLFSLAGIPPLAGFFAKFYVFLAAIKAGLFTLAVLGVLASVVGAYYYLLIVKIMYFDEPVRSFDAMPGRLRVVLGLSGLVNMFFLCLSGAAAWAGDGRGEISILNAPRSHGPGGGPTLKFRYARLDQCRGAGACACRRARPVVDQRTLPGSRPRPARERLDLSAGQSLRDPAAH